MKNTKKRLAAIKGVNKKKQRIENLIRNARETAYELHNYKDNTISASINEVLDTISLPYRSEVLLGDYIYSYFTTPQSGRQVLLTYLKKKIRRSLMNVKLYGK